MTETNPASFQSGTDDPADQGVATVGRVHPHVEVKVVDAESCWVVPRGALGELCRHGSRRCSAIGRTRRRPTRRSTGPAGCAPATLATLDQDGCASIVGRIASFKIRYQMSERL
jgi:fatty-acyl-CoA synthase